MPKPIAIFNTGPLQRTLGAFQAVCGGDNDYLFTKACGLAPADVVDVDVEMTDDLPAAADLAGVIVTGSASMVTDRLPWSERAAAWIRDNRDRVPVLGVCFGHQLIAHAYGGMVAWNPRGPEYGTVEVTVTPAAKGDPLMVGMPQRFAVQSAHHQTVVALPAGCTILAEGDSGLHAARFSKSTWGVQFHPEYDARINAAVLEIFSEGLAKDGVDVTAGRASIRSSETALGVLRNFVAICARATQVNRRAQ